MFIDSVLAPDTAPVHIYSNFALQFGVNPYSTPTPAAAPGRNWEFEQLGRLMVPHAVAPLNTLPLASPFNAATPNVP